MVIKIFKKIKQYLPLGLSSGLLLFIIGYIIHANFAYYWTMLNSEMAEDLAFVRYAAEQGTLFPDEWMFTREIRLMHITSVIIPIYLITGNLNLSYPIASTLLLLVNVLLFFYMMRSNKTRILSITLGLIVLMAFFSVMGTVEVYPIFNVLFLNSSYAVHLACIMFTLGVYLRIRTNEFKLNRRGITLLIISAFVAFGQGLQSDRLLIALYLPLFLTEMCFLVSKYRGRISKRKEILPATQISLLKRLVSFFKSIDKSTVFVLVLFLMSLLGAVLIKMMFAKEILITHYDHANNLVTISNGEIVNRFGYYLDNLFHALGIIGGKRVLSIDGLLYFFRMASIVVLIAIMNRIHSKKTSYGNGCNINNAIITTLSFSFIISSLIMTFIIIEYELTSRYLFTVILLISVAASIATDYFIKSKQKIFTVITCLVIFTISIISIISLPLEKDENLIKDRQAVADFIRNTGINYGYGISWQGKVIEAFAEGDFTMFYIYQSIDSLMHRGATISQIRHDENEVFLVLSGWQADAAMENEYERAILEKGTRYDIQGGWTVYLFNENPWKVW